MVPFLYYFPTFCTPPPNASPPSGKAVWQPATAHSSRYCTGSCWWDDLYSAVGGDWKGGEQGNTGCHGGIPYSALLNYDFSVLSFPRRYFEKISVWLYLHLPSRVIDWCLAVWPVWLYSLFLPVLPVQQWLEEEDVQHGIWTCSGLLSSYGRIIHFKLISLSQN